MKQLAFFLLAVMALAAIFGIFMNVYSRVETARVARNNEQMANFCFRAKNNPPDPIALNSLIVRVHSRDFLERAAAIAYLGQVGSNAQPAVGILIKILHGNDLYDAREAAISLGEIGPCAKDAVPALMNTMQDNRGHDVEWLSAESLGKIADPSDVSVIAFLQKFSKSSNENMRRCADLGLQAMAQRHQGANSTSQP